MRGVGVGVGVGVGGGEERRWRQQKKKKRGMLSRDVLFDCVCFVFGKDSVHGGGGVEFCECSNASTSGYRSDT